MDGALTRLALGVCVVLLGCTTPADSLPFHVGDCITPDDCPGHHCCPLSVRIVRATETGYLLAPSLSNRLGAERFFDFARAAHFKRTRDDCCR